MAARCMLCGKPLEESSVKPANAYEDEYNDDDDERFSKNKSSQFCIMCQAKLKNEADKGQKIAKPM